MELKEMLDRLNRTEAILRKLENIWEQAKPHIPQGPSAGTTPEYENLRRTWSDLIKGLPLIEGSTIVDELPDIDDLGRSFLVYQEMGLPPYDAWTAADKPGLDLAEYGYKLGKVRRIAVRDRSAILIESAEATLPLVVDRVDRMSFEVVTGEDVLKLRNAFGEIDLLMNSMPKKSDRWGDLNRHLNFGQGQDWHDIQTIDWPSIKPDIIALSATDFDPLPVPEDFDLMSEAIKPLSGPISLQLAWKNLNAEQFESLLFNLIGDLDNHENVERLQKTNAPDSGRDLSCLRRTDTGAGEFRTERVLVQAKHWQSKSVSHHEIMKAVDDTKLWQNSKFHIIVFATSGSFTVDALKYAEAHNDQHTNPHLELWPQDRLEKLLASRPALVESFGLRRADGP
ncbi:restriction endonuclease [Corynebacterium sp. S7]